MEDSTFAQLESYIVIQDKTIQPIREKYQEKTRALSKNDSCLNCFLTDLES